MTAPTPPIELEGHCSVIYNNTLYAFSPKGFLSIPLKENGNWTRLDPGVGVSGAVCLTGGMEGNESDEAFYVVGGTGASSANYMGLQRYSFKDQKWESLNARGGAVKDLQYHGAGYIKSSSEILVYGGSNTGDKVPSPATLLISTISPYDVSAEPPQGAPAALEPTLTPWSDSQVAMIGGSADPGIYLYGASTGWKPSGATLPSPVQAAHHCVLVTSHGDKVVEEFHLGVKPNTVTSYIVSNHGKPMNPAIEVGASSGKRSVSNYPTYDGTLAPAQKRSGYALAQADNGLVVVSSGKSERSLAIFNSTSNSWVNSTELFYGSNQQHTLKATTTSTTSNTTPTATTSSTASNTHTSSPTPAAAPSGGSDDDLGTILGATLGSVTGLALILLVILFLLRRQRQKRNRAGRLGAGKSKDRLSFQDQGIEPLTEGAYPMAKSSVPLAGASNDSLAIMSGKTTGEKSLKPPAAHVGYGLSSKPDRGSPLSTIPSSGLAPSSMYSEDANRSAAGASDSGPGNKPGDRTTDEGWGKYFQEDNNATQLAGMQGERTSDSSVYTKSDYRGSSAWPMADLPPLNFGFLDQPKPIGRVVSGSPTTENASSRSLAIPEGQSARISSADSGSLASDDDDPHDTKWTGTSQNSWLGRPPSSNYSASFYNSSTRDLPASASQPGPRKSDGRHASVVVPENIDELSIQGRGNNVNTDMSWLNIHADR